MSIQPDSKTVVIGVGGAGAEMVGSLKSMVEDEGYSRDDFLYIGIDSRDVRDVGIDDKWTIKLDWDDQTGWRNKQASYYYLDEDDGPPSNEGGVDRNRPVARGVIDDATNVSTLIHNVTSAVELFAGDAQNVDIWVVNSLGGGSGSGSQPMILALLQALEEAEFGRMNLFALATVPSLDVDPDTQFPGDIDVEAVPNAFGALTELRQLVDVEAYENPPGLEIDLELDTGNVELFRAMEGKALPLRRGPLEAYYLLGIDEERIEEGDDGYEEAVEQTAALTIIAQSMAEENFPDRERPQFAGRLLHTVDASACSFPYSDVTEYVSKAVRHRWLGEQQSALSDADTLFESNESLLQAVSKIRQGEDEVESDQVKNLVAYVDDKLEETTGLKYWDEKEIIRENALKAVSPTDDDVEPLNEEFEEDALEGIDEQHSPGSPSDWLAEQTDESVLPDETEISPVMLILEYLFYVRLEERLEIEKSSAEQRFRDGVDELFDELRSKMDSSLREEFNRKDGYDRKWNDVLSPFVDRRIDEVREGGFLRPGDPERANELAERQTEIGDDLSDFTSLVDVGDELGTLIIQTHSRLRKLLDWYDEEREAITETVSRIEANRNSISGQMENVADRLSERSGEKFVSMRISDPEEIVTGYFTESDRNELEVIDDLVDEYDLGDEDNPRKAAIERHLREEITVQDLEQRDVVDASELEEDLRNVVSRLEERVADNGNITNSVILPISHDGDDWFEAMGQPDANYNNALLMGLNELAAAMIADARGEVSGGVPGVIRFLFVNPDVTLDDASEYTTIREWYETGVLSDKIGADRDDPADVVNFAYPKLADVDTGVPTEAGDTATDDEEE